MINKNRNLVEVCIDGLRFPLQIGKKNKTEGDTTVTSISIKSKIENIHEENFEHNILNIINRRDNYIGPLQLTDRLFSYLTSINARSIDIKFAYPLFLEKKFTAVNRKQLMEYNCRFEVQKNILPFPTRKFTIEIPIIAKEYVIPGIQTDIFEIPVVIVVEVIGSDVYFMEDFIGIVEKQINGIYSNLLTVLVEETKPLLLRKIENEIYKVFNVEKCSVKMITRKVSYSYSAKLVDEPEELRVNNEYETEHLFI